jgi:hypothetical protein
MPSSSAERPRKTASSWLLKRVRKAKERVQPLWVLSRPRTYLRLLRGEGSLRERYEDALTEHGLERLVSHELGCPLKCSGHQEIGRNPKSGRSYARYTVVPADGAVSKSHASGGIDLFVKRGDTVAKYGLEKYLTRKRGEDFYVPAFYGRFRVNGTNVAVWEFVAGRRIHFAPPCGANIMKAVDGLAAVAALPYDEVVRTGVSVGMSWLRPHAEELELLVRSVRPTLADAPDLLRRTESLAALEGRILARFDEFGHAYLAHNDIGSRNLLLRPEDDRVAIIDWASARLSVPGASLRPIATWPEPARNAIAARFVDQMMQFGRRTAIADVLLAADGTMLFRLLAQAVSSGGLQAARKGLALAARLEGRI